MKDTKYKILAYFDNQSYLKLFNEVNSDYAENLQILLHNLSLFSYDVLIIGVILYKENISNIICDYRLAQRLEAVRDKNKNQAQMEALKSLRHNFDLDSVHNLSGFDRRLVCVPKFCPRECPGKAGCRYQKHLDISRKEDIFLQICNHNYLLADAMHRANGYRPLLADYRALVVDEAHKLPEAASQMYGRSIGREDVQEIAYFLVREHSVLTCIGIFMA